MGILVRVEQPADCHENLALEGMEEVPHDERVVLVQERLLRQREREIRQQGVGVRGEDHLAVDRIPDVLEGDLAHRVTRLCRVRGRPTRSSSVVPRARAKRTITLTRGSCRPASSRATYSRLSPALSARAVWDSRRAFRTALSREDRATRQL